MDYVFVMDDNGSLSSYHSPRALAIAEAHDPCISGCTYFAAVDKFVFMVPLGKKCVLVEDRCVYSKGVDHQSDCYVDSELNELCYQPFPPAPPPQIPSPRAPPAPQHPPRSPSPPAGPLQSPSAPRSMTVDTEHTGQDRAANDMLDASLPVAIIVLLLAIAGAAVMCALHCNLILQRLQGLRLLSEDVALVDEGPEPEPEPESAPQQPTEPAQTRPQKPSSRTDEMEEVAM